MNKCKITVLFGKELCLRITNVIRGSSFHDWMIGPEELWHEMSDEELMWRASMVPRISKYPKNRTRKVAFMFLSRGSLPLGPLWEMFFKGHAGLYSVYLHTSPEFTKEPPESSVFYMRKITSKHVEWGQATMMDVERRLLANALLDFSNERFVLLSETCIPLFNFTTIYNYLINSNHSFDHCKPPCYMDEHYLAILVTKTHSDMNSNRSITWVDWSKGGSHPTRFVKKDVSKSFFNRVRHGFNCTYNGSLTTVCFLFARKFQPNTLEALLKIAPTLLGFNP
ncbi:hypothetical protein I3843_06G016700 [Carya illinoinensis]|nr:hypothetical protein I3843_06G016700 [Carya illinoinensis]